MDNLLDMRVKYKRYFFVYANYKNVTLKRTKVEVIEAFHNGFRPTPIYWLLNLYPSKKIQPR